jgi:hypothetical protein
MVEVIDDELEELIEAEELELAAELEPEEPGAEGQAVTSKINEKMKSAVKTLICI